MRLHTAPLLVGAIALLGALAACHDAVRPASGCVTDDECAGARICDEGRCVDPVLTDAGGDAALDGGSDAAPDAELPELPPPPPPQLCLEAVDGEVGFGLLTQGESTARRVTLRNCGRLEVSVEALELLDPDGVFELVRVPGLPLVLGAAQTAELVVRATPPAVGGWAGALLASDAGGALVEVPLRVESALSDGETCLRFAPPAVSFGRVALGEQREATVRVLSCSPNVIEPLVLVPPQTPGLAATGLPAALTPGEQAEVVVTWEAPATAGVVQDAVLIELADGTPLARLPVLGAAVDADAGCLEAEPASVELPETTVGSTVFSTATLRNCGDTELELQQALVDGSELSVSYAIGALAPGEERVVTVSWTPSVAGLRAGSWRVPTATGVEYGPWIVFGRALAAEPPPLRGPAIELRPASTDLGAWPTGARVPLAFEVCNVGDATLTLSGAVGEGAVEVSDPAWALGPVAEGACVVGGGTLQVGDDATARGVVRVRSDARNASVATFTASATAVPVPADVCLRALVERIDLAAQVGQLVDGELAFENCGVTDLIIGSIEVAPESGAGTPDLEVGADPGPGAPLGPGEVVRVRFSAVSGRALNAIWRVTARSREGAAASSILRASFTDVPAACVEPARPTIDLGVVRLGQVARRDVAFRNCGTTAIALAGARLETSAGAGFVVERDVAGLRVEPGAEFTVGIALRPERLGAVEGRLTVAPSAGPASEPVVLRASVVEQTDPTQCIEVEPGSIDLGRVPLGSVYEEALQIRNCADEGEAAVFVRLADGAQGWALSSGETELPPIPAGGVETVLVFLEAFRPGPAEDAIEILAADSGDVVIVPIRALVGEDGPICSPPLVGVATDPAGPFEPALAVRPNTELYLSASFADAAARGIWSVIDAPPSASREVSPAEVPSADGRVPTYRTTVEGTYVFGFRWVDSEGCEGEESVFVDVRGTSGVGEGLRVVVTWRTPGDPDELTDPGSDVDLHLGRRVGGRVRWNSDDDCYYGNPQPSWGSAASEDDPRLLRDELDGLGPEIIVLESPSEVIYYVAVHYFSDDGFGRSEATLRVFFDGVQIGSATRALNRTGEVWLAATVTNLGETVTFLPGPNSSGFPVSVP